VSFLICDLIRKHLPPAHSDEGGLSSFCWPLCLRSLWSFGFYILGISLSLSLLTPWVLSIQPLGGLGRSATSALHHGEEGSGRPCWMWIFPKVLRKEETSLLLWGSPESAQVGNRTCPAPSMPLFCLSPFFSQEMWSTCSLGG
jgi:hypothetical protein